MLYSDHRHQVQGNFDKIINNKTIAASKPTTGLNHWTQSKQLIQPSKPNTPSVPKWMTKMDDHFDAFRRPKLFVHKSIKTIHFPILPLSPTFQITI